LSVSGDRAAQCDRYCRRQECARLHFSTPVLDRLTE
jgi:hypothetical protein